MPKEQERKKEIQHNNSAAPFNKLLSARANLFPAPSCLRAHITPLLSGRNEIHLLTPSLPLFRLANFA